MPGKKKKAKAPSFESQFPFKAPTLGQPKSPTVKATVPTRASEDRFMHRTAHPSAVKARLKNAAGHKTNVANIDKSSRVYVGPVTVRGDSATATVGKQPAGDSLLNKRAKKARKKNGK